MPYTGKPSGACLTCRNRRIKCDETKPFCQKCRNSNRECLGYKDPSQVKFRDMTAMTIRRYKGSPGTPDSTSASSPSDEDSVSQKDDASRRCSSSVTSLSTHKSVLLSSSVLPAYGTLFMDDAPATTGSDRKSRLAAVREERQKRHKDRGLVPAAPNISVNQHSLSYLFSAYLGGANHFLDTGFSGILETVVAKGKPPRYLSAAISAAGLAAFSRRPNARSLATKAEKIYTIALTEVNLAMEQPDSTYDDDLLASILILALYELFMSQKLTGYYNHILGAATIFKIRSRQVKPVTNTVAAMCFIFTRNELMKSSLLFSLGHLEKDVRPWLSWITGLGLDSWTAISYSYLPPSIMSGAIKHFKALVYSAIDDAPIFKVFPVPQPEPTELPSEGLTTEPSTAGIDHSNASLTRAAPSTADAMFGQVMAIFKPISVRIRRFMNIDKAMSEGYDIGSATPQSLPAGISREVEGWVLFPDSPIYVYRDMLHAGYRLALALMYLEPSSKAVGMVMHTPELGFLKGMEEYQELERMGKLAVAEIVGSIPFFCGLLPSHMTGLPSPGMFDLAGIRDAQAISFAIWAIASAIASPISTGADKEYLLGMLRYCHQVKGLGQAFAIYETCIQAHKRSTAPQEYQESISAPWMGRGTSLEGIIYGSSAPISA